MAETFDSLVTAVSRRVRDPNNTAHSATDVAALLFEAERIVNAAVQGITAVKTLTLATPTHPFVSIFSNGIVQPIQIRVGAAQNEAGGDVPLPYIDWRSLSRDAQWLTRRSPRPSCWSLVGRDLMLLWPQWTGPLTVRVTYLYELGDTDITELQDQHMPAMVALTESVLLLRQRLFASLPHAVERFQASLTRGKAA